jgi:hypothetical protein
VPRSTQEPLVAQEEHASRDMQRGAERRERGDTQSRETANRIKATNSGNPKGGSGDGGVDGVVDQEGGAGTHSDKPQFSGWGALVDVG